MSDEIHKQVLQTNRGRRTCPEHRDNSKMREVPEGEWIHSGDKWMPSWVEPYKYYQTRRPGGGWNQPVLGKNLPSEWIDIKGADPDDCPPLSYSDLEHDRDTWKGRFYGFADSAAGIEQRYKDEIAELRAKVSHLEALTDLQSRMLDGAIDDSAVDEKDIAALTAERDRLQAKLTQCEDHNKVLLEALRSRSDRHLKPGGILTPNGDDYI